MKIKTMFAVALAAVVTLASCSKEDNSTPNGGDTTRVVLEVKKPAGTRAEGSTVAAHQVQFQNGYVYFVDGSGVITDVFTIVTTTPTPETNEINLAAGSVSFDGVSGKSQHIYILGNVPALSYAKGADISDVLAEAVEIKSQNNSLSASTVANVTLYGKTETAINHAGNPSTASLTVKPIGSRIEVKEFKAVKIDNSTPTAITTYRIDGIFLNNFYQKSTVAGVKTTNPNNDKIYYAKEANGQTPVNFVTNGGVYTPANDGYIFNANEARGIGTYTSATKVYAPTTSGNVWAYNLFAPEAGEMPHLVVRVSGLNAEVGVGNQIRWMTVTKFVDADNTASEVAFEPGKIYKIQSFEFNETNLDVAPEMKTVSALVTVSLVSWEEKTVKPW